MLVLGVVCFDFTVAIPLLLRIQNSTQSIMSLNIFELFNSVSEIVEIGFAQGQKWWLGASSKCKIGTSVDGTTTVYNPAATIPIAPMGQSSPSLAIDLTYHPGSTFTLLLSCYTSTDSSGNQVRKIQLFNSGGTVITPRGQQNISFQLSETDVQLKVRYNYI